MFRSLAVALAALVLSPAAPAPAQWLAGDGHVHTCYSHDAWCPPDDDNTGPDTFYSSLGSVPERFAEAYAKGLDFLVISDHDDIRAWTDPAFGSQGVLGIRAYEASLPGGHAHHLGATRRYEKGPAGSPEEAAASLAAAQAELEADGGMLQANHPGYRGEESVDGCEDFELDRWATTPMHWRYGFAVRPTLIEVFNPTSLMQPAELLWECWLQRGARIGAGAGSDSHGGNQANLGIPTLWVLAAERTEAAVLDAMRRGRTTITRRPPSAGVLRLELEGPRGEVVGDRVAPGATVTARLVGGGAGWLRVRGNGATLADRVPIAAGQPVTFRAPRQAGWVRASLLMTSQSLGTSDPACVPGPFSAGSPLSLCSDDLVVAALTSPLYVGRRAAPQPRPLPRPSRRGARRPQLQPSHSEPDDQPHLPAARHSGHGTDLPAVPLG